MLSAAIAESNRGAFVDWCREVGVETSAGDLHGRRRPRPPLPALRPDPAGQPGRSLRPRHRPPTRRRSPTCATQRQLSASPDRPPSVPPASPQQPSSPAPPDGHRPSQAPSADEAAQREFVRQAPAILSDVLSRLSASNQERLLDVGRLDPHSARRLPRSGRRLLPRPSRAPRGATGDASKAADSRPSLHQPSLRRSPNQRLPRPSPTPNRTSRRRPSRSGWRSSTS